MYNQWVIIICLLIITACSGQENNNIEMKKKGNRLTLETSPYLLQHAYNPVDWHPWNESTLEKAKKENKLLLISIGYSACHWCHVMEHESFEDNEVAKIMNENFICIKVDREERPDIDQIYMTAVQLLNNRGGWPLNCIALPNGKPFWGGTYFRKDDWKQQILQISNIYQKEPEKVEEFAEKLSQGIRQTENIVENPEKESFRKKDLHQMISLWEKRFDKKEGGTSGSPKFPMPNSYQFLLRYGHLTKNLSILNHVELTLNKIAYGGIYDQIGGGFARYSVDEYWKVPHFEKMLYDNGQLVSLYSEAYLKFKNPLYKEVVLETLKFVKNDLMNTEGAFYSSLDADTEGEEGRFYIWNESEVEKIIQSDFKIIKDYYSIGDYGLWEHEKNILIRRKSKEKVARDNSITVELLKNKIENWKKKLLEVRNKRTRPGLDDKSLTSWNAIMLKGFIDAYMTFGKKEHLDIAIKNANFIINKQMQKDGRLFHSYKNNNSTINGYLEDYSLTILSLIRLYEATLDEKWIEYSDHIAKYTISHFYNDTTGMFYFTSDLDPKLIARKTEIHDNVIPASNSVIANALYDLGRLTDNEKYKEISIRIINNINPHMKEYGSGYANYANLILKQVYPYYEIAVIGNNAKETIREINTSYYPNKMFIGSLEESKISLLKNKYVENETMIYICKNKVCDLPTNKIQEALKQIK